MLRGDIHSHASLLMSQPHYTAFTRRSFPRPRQSIIAPPLPLAHAPSSIVIRKRKDSSGASVITAGRTFQPWRRASSRTRHAAGAPQLLAGLNTPTPRLLHHREFAEMARREFDVYTAFDRHSPVILAMSPPPAARSLPRF